MQKFIAVIGNRNSGKSTVIKSLTGCATSSFRGRVKDEMTRRTIHVLCSSPQEQTLSLAQLRKALRAAAQDPNSQGLVMAIQPTQPTARLSMETILEEVTITAAFDMYAFVLDPGRKGSVATSASVTDRLKSFPSTRRATLDGQRFAHINAQIINRKTRVAS